MRGSSGSTIPRPALCFLALAWPQKLWSAQDKGGVTKIVANEYVMVTVKHRLLAVRVFRVSSGYGYA